VLITKSDRFTAFALSLATFVSGISIVVSPFSNTLAANASANTYLAQIADVNVAGLVIKYRDGVKPLARDGKVTGANFAGVELLPGRGIGLNMYTVGFSKPFSKIEIANAMANLARNPKVEFVAPDQVLKFTGAAYLAPKTVSISKRPKAASPVLKLKAVDAWSSKNPKLAQIRLTWARPKNTYGAKILGYQIDQKVDAAKSFVVVVANTGPNTLKYSFASDLTAGLKYQFRVRAITGTKSKSSFGRYSSSASAAPTTVPQIPVFVSSDAVTNAQAPAWLNQSKSQRGGLPVTYLVTASSPGSPDVTCVPKAPTATTCAFVGLDPAKTYRAKITAKNVHGSAESRFTQSVTDPLFSHQWYLNGRFGINAPNAWSFNKGSYQTGSNTTRVTVAVLDTGYTSHPDLDNQFVRENGQVYGYDFVSNLVKDANSRTPASVETNDSNGWDSDASDPGDYNAFGTRPSSWHGTHIMGLIAAQANNDIGISGVAPDAQILPVRVLGPSGGLSSDLAAAIIWSIGLPVPQFAIENAYASAPPKNIHPAQVINISMETAAVNGCDSATQAAVSAAKIAKVTIVTAAGNNMGQAFGSFPGNCLGTINVGATSSVGDRTTYSNTGPGVDVSAPGGDNTQPSPTDAPQDNMILSTINTGTQGATTPDYEFEEGTSMAAPLVSGIVALMYAAHPAMSFEQAATIIIDNVTPFNTDPSLAFRSASPDINAALNALGHCHAPHVSTAEANYGGDGRCGSGIVNAGAAVAAAAALP